MLVYFITQQYFGEKTTLYPKPAKNGEKNLSRDETPKICVSTSILGALSSIGHKMDWKCNLYVYATKTKEFYQPNLDEVKDEAFTGELWLLKQHDFVLVDTLTLKTEKSFDYNKIRINEFEF
jgi:hypothetical protein